MSNAPYLSPNSFFNTSEEVGGLLINKLLFAQQFLKTSCDSGLRSSQDSSLEVVVRCNRISSVVDEVRDLEEDVRREEGRGMREFGAVCCCTR